MRLKLSPLVLLLAVLLAACGNTGGGTVRDVATPTTPSVSAAGAATGTPSAIKQLKIALLVNGSPGHKGFFDSAKAGVDRAAEELGAEVQVVEERDSANWESTLRSLAEADNDIIVLGTFQMPDALNAVAPDFPDKKFIFFDATVDQPNVANITYAQNEGSFMAGVLSACAANSDLPNVTGDKKIGVVGGEDIPVVNDFIVGYEQGAKYVDPEMEILRSYIGTGAQAYNDRAKGKELASAQFDEGASVVFSVAGDSGLGVLEAAAEQRRYAIGVDSNQNALHPGVVLSSMLKRVDNSVFDLIQREATGSLRTGTTYSYGIQNSGVGLAEDELYEQHVPEECKQQIKKAKQDIASKKVRVETAFK